ncbi:hypothetical protein HN814_01295 [Candidatus Woesearchaeota archaeon]|nr:hypothetical protein [Candidatus Woesearchaeota archaeon]
MFDALLGEGYGTDKLPIRILVGSTPLDKEKSEEIIEVLMNYIGFERQDNHRINSVYNRDDRTIVRYTIKSFSPIGRINKKIVTNKVSLEDKFKWSCKKLGNNPINEGQMCRNSWHGPDIDFCGNLYFCGAQSWKLGNVYEEKMTDMIMRLNECDYNHPKYGKAISILHIMKKLASKSENNHCVGDLLRIMYEKEPKFVESLVKRTQPCWLISRDEKLQDLIISNFNNLLYS